MTLPTGLIVHIAEVLERLGVPYHVGGSVASSAHGMYRASADADFVIDPTHDQLETLAGTLEPEFYVSRSSMAEALAQRTMFNVIHLATSFKVDFFVKGSTPFDDEELRRSIRLAIGPDSAATVLIKSAEDTILRKLDWYRRGEEVSERQWMDVLGILAAMRGQLNEQYLDDWAQVLNVSDLLARARRETQDL